MLKLDEISNPRSCLNKAKDDEFLFVILSRDLAAPAAIRAWIMERINLGLNKEDDVQILEAREVERKMMEPRGELPRKVAGRISESSGE